MKLRINTKLRAALIAAVSAVGFSTFGTGTLAVATGAALFAGQQAYAENADQINAALTTQIQQSGYELGDKYSLTITLGGTPVSGLDANGVGVLLDTGDGLKLFLQRNNQAPKWGHFGMGTDTLAAGSSTTIAPTSVAGDLAGKQAVATWNLESAPTDGAWLNRYLTSSTGSYTVGNREAFNVESATVGVAYDGKDTTLTFTMYESNGPANGVPGTYKIVLADTDLNASGITFGTGCSNYTLSTLSFTATHEFDEYAWAATVDGSNWASSVWQKGEQTEQNFVSGSDAVFDNTATSTEVNISSAVTAHNVTVSDQTYTFNLSGDGASLTANALTVTSGLNIAGARTVSAGSLSVDENASVGLSDGSTLAVNGGVTLGEGSGITVGTGATLKVSSGETAKALMMGTGVTNNGIFEIAGDVTLDNGATTKMGGALKVGSGVTLKLSSGKDNPTSIESFSSVELAGGNLWANTTMRTINALSVTGDSQISFDDFPNAYANNPTKFAGTTRIDSGKTLTVYTNYKSSIQMAGLAGAGTLKLTTWGRDDNGENVTIDTLEGFTGNISLAPGGTNNPVRVTATLGNADVSMGTLSLNGNSGAATAAKHTFFNLTGEHNLTLKGIDGTNGEVSLTVPTLTLDTASNHSYTGSLTISGQIVKTGEGTQTIGSLNLHTALEVQDGTLVLNGVTQTTGASISVGTSGTLTLGGTVTFVDNKSLTNNGAVTLNTTALVFNLDGLTAEEKTSGTWTYTLFSGNDVDLRSLTTSNITLSGGTSGKNWAFGTDGTISYTAVIENVWTDGEQTGRWNYVDANWSNGSFAENDVAKFEGSEIDVMINADIVAGGIRIADAASVTLSEDWFEDGSLSAPTLTIGEGATLNMLISIGGIQQYSLGEGAAWVVASDQTLAAGTGTNSGTIRVVEGVNLTISGTATAADLAGIQNGGTVTVDLGGAETIINMNAASTGTLHVSNGTVDYRSALGEQILQLGNGTTLLFGTNGTDTEHTYAGDIKVAEGDTATVRTWGKNTQPYVKISGDVSGQGTLVRYNDGNQNLDFTGTVNLGGYTNSDAQGGSSTDFQGATTLGTLTADAGSTTKFSGSKAELGSVTLNGNAAVEINTAATVSTLLDLSAGGNSSGTVTVKSGKSLSIAQNATYWGAENSSIVVEEGGTLNLAGMQIVGVDGSAVVGTTAANEQYGIDKGSWSIYGADITATKAITVGNELSFSSVNTGEYAVQLTNENNLLAGATVGENGSLSMTGGELLDVIANAGSVTLTSITLNDEIFIEEGGEEGAHFGLDGKATEGANYYLGTADKYVTVVDGGTSATGSNITWGTTTGLTMTDGKVVTQAGEVAYGTFYVNDDSVNVSAITNTNTTNVEVAGGTLVVDQETELNISVTDEGTITGDHADATQVGIDNFAKANFSQPVETASVEFTAAEGDVVSITNIGEKAAFSTSNKDMIVSAGSLKMIDVDHDAVVSNMVFVDEIVNETGHVLTLDNIDSLPLVSMTIGQGSTVKVGYTDQDAFVEGTVTITETLEAGGGTLLANLTIIGSTDENGVATTTLDLDGAGEKALTLGSTLTMNTDDGLIALDINTLDALEALGLGETLTLVKAYDQTTLTYGADGQESYDGMWFDAMFERMANFTGDYLVVADGAAFGLKKVSNVPEPTTGTLSLLALAALAARRRRK